MSPEDRHTASNEPTREKKRFPPSYSTPRLQRLGDIRDITFGPSPGTVDSPSGAEINPLAGPGDWVP